MYFPVFMDLSEKEILVVGGGAIASRRVQILRGFCRHITVVAPEISSEIQSFEDAASGIEAVEKMSECMLTVHQRVFQNSDLEGKTMVLAATDDSKLNRQIANLCRDRGIPVNDCSDQSLCDFQFPSVVQCGEVVIGINASGKNHSRVKETRQKIEQALGCGEQSKYTRYLGK